MCVGVLLIHLERCHVTCENELFISVPYDFLIGNDSLSIILFMHSLCFYLVRPFDRDVNRSILHVPLFFWCYWSSDR